VHEPWEVLGSRTILSNPFVTVRQEQLRLPSGSIIDAYNVVDQPSYATVFGVTEDDQVVFVRQYRHGARGIFLELPSGQLHPDEDPSVAAERELVEETGYAGRVQPAGTFTVDPTRSGRKEHLFLARVHRAGAQRLDDTEAIEVVLAPVSQVREMIDRGDICVQPTVAACLFCLPLVGSLAH
jgi:8-oxo-dGTP pyrophosphatase MutT (NUDIX family)